VTRLLSKVRLLANFSAVLALAAAVVMATNHPQSAHGVVLALLVASLVPTSLISASWLLALARAAAPPDSPSSDREPVR
jgi:hypothetical protein